jgi:hypothetical protein
METLPKALGRRLGSEELPGAEEVVQLGSHARAAGVAAPRAPAAPGPGSVDDRPRAPVGALRARMRTWGPTQVALAVYAGSRLLFFVIALVDLLRTWRLQIPSAELLSPGLVPSVVSLAHPQLLRELSNWDGVWYVDTAVHWYPHAVVHWQSTLGFLPLYPMAMWLVSHVLFCSVAVAGLLISLVGGAVAAVLVQRLATQWWGEHAGRRALLFFCLFPGSIVFSMVYSEGLTVPLAAGCLLALAQRRWLLAGLLAALATAVEPVALAVIPACAVAAVGELRSRGLRERGAWRSLVAPALSPLGIGAFGVFLWAWTGTPLATYDVQRYSPGWAETTSPLALVNAATKMVSEPLDFSYAHYPLNINLNYENGVFGALFLLFALWLIVFRLRPRMPAPALALVLAVAALTLTSANTPPNPRMLLCAFPALMAVAAWAEGRRFRWLMGTELALTLICSPLVFVSTTLRP